MTQDQELEQIKSKIQDHLISSGTYETINQNLKLKLYESGWYDKISSLTLKELQNNNDNNEPINFNDLFQLVKPKAEDLVPNDVKNEIMEKIKDYLEDVTQ